MYCFFIFIKILNQNVRILHLGMMEREGIVIFMLNTPHGALNTPKITTAQISIVASVVNRIMVKLAYKLSISNNF